MLLSISCNPKIASIAGVRVKTFPEEGPTTMETKM
jgi:hypothetical protein